MSTGTAAGGPRDPTTTTPARPRASVRRTSHIDIRCDPSGGLLLSGAARDLRTATDATATLAGEAAVDAVVGPDRRLHDLMTTPAVPGADALIGLVVGPGFRAAVAEALPEQHDGSSPLYLLLDDLPVAALISGYALLYRDELGDRPAGDAMLKSDVCAGWRADGIMMVSLAANGRVPVPVGPPAPDLDRPDDPLSWHRMEPLAAGAMRRRRLVEVTAGDPFQVYAMFRDTHTDSSGVETVLHEYLLTAALDPRSLVLTRCEARPLVLPWPECPAAAASATRLNGLDVAHLRAVVREQFRGTSTCTHLNDLLRSLGDLGALVPAVS